MNKKTGKILGWGMVAILASFSLVSISLANPVLADEMEWSKVSTPSWEDNVIVPGSDIYDYTSGGGDGNTIYAVGAINTVGLPGRSVTGLVGSFSVDSGSVTITRVSDNVASVSGSFRGEACYLRGAFTMYGNFGTPSGDFAVSGEVTPGKPGIANDDKMTFSGKIYGMGVGGLAGPYYASDDDSLCVNNWSLSGQFAGYTIFNGTYTQPRVWKSTNGGVTWKDITSTVQKASNLPGPFIQFGYGGVALAPDDEDWLVVAGEIFHPDYSPGFVGMPAAVASKDDASNFSYTGNLRDFAKGTLMGLIYDVAVSPEMDGIHNVAVAGINDAGNGTIYRLKAGTWLTGAWQDTSFYDGWDEFVSDAPSVGVVAVDFSPNFDMDDTIVCMSVDDDALPYLQEGIWESGGSWNGEAGFPDAVQIKNDGSVLWTEPGLRAMGFALPADFDGTNPRDNNIYLYVNAYDSVTKLTGGYVMIAEDGDLTARCGPSGNPLLASIDVYGDADTCKAMVGTMIGWKNVSGSNPGDPIRFKDCEGVAVYHTVELDDCCPQWEAACKNPSGPYAAVVSYTPDGEKAYATTSGALDPQWIGFGNRWGTGVMDLSEYWGGLCDESAFSVSLDDGVSFNQIGLIDTDIDYLSDIAVCPDCSVIYLATVNKMEEWGECCEDSADVSQVASCDSIWRSYDNGDTWERIYHGDWTENAENAIMLRLPCDDLEDCCTVYMGVQDTKNLYYSRDCGQCWNKAVNQKLTIQDFAIESENIVYVLDKKGYVSTSTQYGRRPSDGVDTKVGSGHSITSCCDAGLVLVGGKSDEPVGYSDDGGKTWDLTDDLPGDGGTVHVACDTACSTDPIIYGATDEDGSGGAIYRSNLDDGSWDDLNANDYPYSGIAIGRSDGTLYASSYAIGVDTTVKKICDRFTSATGDDIDWYSGVARNLTPCETDCCGEESWDYLIAGLSPNPDEYFNNKPSALRICGCISIDTNSILWAIDWDYYDVTDGSDGTLWSYEDCAAKKGPVLTSPADEAIVDCDACAACVGAPLVLKWERMCLTCSWDIEIMDENGNLIKEYIDKDISGDPPKYYVNDAALRCGKTYTWHVRVANTETGECVHSPWSETWSFTIASGAADAVQLIAPEIGAMGIPISNVGFSWTSVPGATKYSFVLSPNADLSGALATSDQSGTAYAYSGTLDYEVSYYWQVTAWKDGVMLSQSHIGTFSTASEEIITEPPAPGEPPVINMPATQQIVPTWIYAIIGIGAALIVVVIVLVFRTKSPS